MEVKTSQKEEVTVFQICGEINITTSPELRKLFEKNCPKKIVVDLTAVGYIDSSGLATLVEMLKRCKSQGGSLGLAGMSEKVKSLFEITKLDKLFLVFPNPEEAVGKVK